MDKELLVSSQESRVFLQTIRWEEGKMVPIMAGPYRHQLIVCCCKTGRQRAMFANGEHTYSCYFELVDDRGKRTPDGVAIVPVLPDDRLIMVVEQRPPQGCHSERPMIARIGGKDIDLNAFGRDSSLEFPGGTVELSQNLSAAFLDELTQETGVGDQTAACYSRCHPIWPFGSDLGRKLFFKVVFLTGLHFEEYVESDGGLNIFALTEDEVEYNIHKGVICSGQAALLGWGFYLEVKKARTSERYMAKLLAAGYLSIEEVKIKKA